MAAQDFPPAHPPIAGEPNFDALPRRVDKRRGAALVSTFKFPVSPRALQDWPLDWIVVNAKSICDTAQLFAEADQRLAAGRRRATARRSEHSAPLSPAA